MGRRDLGKCPMASIGLYQTLSIKCVETRLEWDMNQGHDRFQGACAAPELCFRNPNMISY